MSRPPGPPDERRVAVLGAGVAGVAAAWAARRRGYDVVVYHVTAGATELASGVADWTPWAPAPVFAGGAVGDASRAGDGEARLDAEEEQFLVELDYWRRGPSTVATTAGVVRPCQAADPALLDLSAVSGRSIGVVDVERDDWDAAALARILKSSPWARATGTTFHPVPLAMLREGHERRIPAADFAALHDCAERRGGLVEKLRDFRASSPSFAALLFGPWLGLEPSTLAELCARSPIGSDLLIGECTSLPGGPSGLRFVRARETLFTKLGVEVREERVTRLHHEGGAWQVTSAERARAGDTAADGAAEGRPEAEPRRSEPFSCVVLAVGGLVSGGVVFSPRQESGSAFRLNLEAPVRFSISGEPLEQVSSCYGFDPTTAGGAWLERAGVLVDPAGRVGQAGLSAAGDVVAGRARTVLAAVRCAIRAVREAASAA